MKLFMIGAAFAAALSLTACANPDFVAAKPGGAPVPSGSTALSQKAQQALYALESAYNVAGHAYLASEGSMAPETKAKAKASLQAAYQALLAARRAATLADSAGVLSAVGAARAHIDAAPGLTQQS